MSVRSSWVVAVFLSGVALFLSGCGDSSDVGLGVGPDSDSLEGGQPVTFNVNPELDTTSLVPRTGRDLTPSLGGDAPTWRFLVGRVDDPLTGESGTDAEGYMDVSPPASLPGRISSADPDSIAAELRLNPNYVHGDTASSVDIEVLELAEEAAMDRARADTSFPVGSPATDGPASIRPNPDDSLVTISLSDAWVEDRLDDLQQDSLDAFFGFKLTTGSSEDAVVGFAAGSSSLRLVHRGDSTTAEYSAIKAFTHVERTGPPASPPDTASHRLLQDGVGAGLKMRWDFDDSPLDTLNTDPLNRAQIFVPVDTTAMKAEAGPSTFVRPAFPKGFRVIATRESAPGTPPCSAVRAATFSEDGRECALPLVPSAAPGAALVSNEIAFPTFDRSFQRTRNGQPPVFEDVRLFVADREDASGNPRSTIQPGLPTTLPILVATGGGDPGPPRATLTVTPL
jgi:hypothetical protein